VHSNDLYKSSFVQETEVSSLRNKIHNLQKKKKSTNQLFTDLYTNQVNNLMNKKENQLKLLRAQVTYKHGQF